MTTRFRTAGRVLTSLFALAAFAVPALADQLPTEDSQKPFREPIEVSNDHRACLEISNDDGQFIVRECLLQSNATLRKVVATPRIPEIMSRIVASELLWAEQLLPELNQPGSSQGVLSRQGRLGQGDWSDLGTHAFGLHVAGGPDFVAFALRLDDHHLASLEGEVDDSGNGFLLTTHAETGTQRKILFSKGAPLSDSGAGVGAKSQSTFYMGCLIDTPRFDLFSPNVCRQLGSQPTTTVFKLFLPYTPSHVIWTAPSSSCNGIWCSGPISPSQTVVGHAYWVINGIPTGPLSAQAIYYFEPGF